MKISELKNDKLRSSFLEDHENTERGWMLWLKNDLINRRIWRYNLPDGSSIYAEDELMTFEFPVKVQSWHTIRWYLRSLEQDVSGAPFADSLSSKTLLMVKLKDLQYDR